LGIAEVLADSEDSMNVRSSSEIRGWVQGFSDEKKNQTTLQSMPNTPEKEH
jgi:hypothetical protein